MQNWSSVFQANIDRFLSHFQPGPPNLSPKDFPCRFERKKMLLLVLTQKKYIELLFQELFYADIKNLKKKALIIFLKTWPETQMINFVWSHLHLFLHQVNGVVVKCRFHIDIYLVQKVKAPLAIKGLHSHLFLKQTTI